VKDLTPDREEIVHRETRAWDTQDVDLLLSVFHPDMVWPWPRTYHSHDPEEWVLVPHNRRRVVRIEVSAEEDGAFAVVDIDTLWRRSDGVEQHWLGRVCKVYAFVRGEWKMTAHTGALDYSVVR
jgi:ketosteroid isomerase-like protein